MDANFVLLDGSTTYNDTTYSSTAAMYFPGLTSVASALEVGPMSQPLWLHINIPSVSSGDTMTPTIQFCATKTGAAYYTMTLAKITAAGEYHKPFFCDPAYPWMRVLLTSDGTSATTYDFGAVKMWVDTAARYTK